MDETIDTTDNRQMMIAAVAATAVVTLVVVRTVQMVRNHRFDKKMEREYGPKLV